MSPRPTVLLVEDDPDLLRLADTILRLEGYQPLTATDGEAAVALARRQRPDLIVLDLWLPRLDGWGVLDALQQDAALATVPVILVTASHEPSDRERARAARVARYVNKPVTADDLLDAVGAALAASG